VEKVVRFVLHYGGLSRILGIGSKGWAAQYGL